MAETFDKGRIFHQYLSAGGDLADTMMGCGFMRKTGKACLEQNYQYPFYSGCVVLCGHGEYVDATRGDRYPMAPGCLVQRMPGVRHHTIVQDDGEWLEFFFNGAAPIFQMLVKLRLVSARPVFFLGLQEDGIALCTQYMGKQRKAQNDAAQVLAFQEFLCHLNALANHTRTERVLLSVRRDLQENCQVGTQLKDVAARHGMSYAALRKLFYTHCGMSMTEFRIRHRMMIGKHLMAVQHYSVKEAAIELGYCDEYAFSKQFKQYEGASPKEFLRQWGEEKRC